MIKYGYKKTLEGILHCSTHMMSLVFFAVGLVRDDESLLCERMEEEIFVPLRSAAHQRTSLQKRQQFGFKIQEISFINKFKFDNTTPR